MHEVITLQVGQCGNQLGAEFWRNLRMDHGIDESGVLVSPKEDRKDKFFYQADNGIYIPRSILVDTEPRVVEQYINNFNPENILVTGEGVGAGNNWAHGYMLGSQSKAELLDIIQKEAEACDMLETFNLIHSVAGGTGSGAGSLLVESLKDVYPKQILQSYSVLPHNSETSDVVVQPYNTVITLNYLSQYCDEVIIMDNSSLGRVSAESIRVKELSFNILNLLASKVIAFSNSTVRFPGPMFCDSRSLHVCSVPVPQYNFVVPSFAPFVHNEFSKLVRKTDTTEVMRKLMLPKTSLCTYDTQYPQHSIAILNIFEGVKEAKEITRATDRVFYKKMVNFVDWMGPFFQTAISKRPTEHNMVTGLSLSNSSGISNVLHKILKQFDRLKKRNAFVDTYKKYCMDPEVFDQSRERMQTVVDNYEKCVYGSQN